MFKKFSRLGQAFMLPIAILPVAGLLLGLGAALSNDAAISAFPFLGVSWLQTLFSIMSAAGNAVFTNLPLIFTIGVAVGLADRDKGTAGLSAAVAYLVFAGTIAVLLEKFSAEDASIDTGVLGALVIGLIVTRLHNKYRQKQLPEFLGFFGGNRFVPIISALTAILISIYPLFWYTSLGGSENVAGEMISGAQNIYFAQLADPNHVGLYTRGTRFFAGRFGTMIFGLPAACLGMYHSIPKENRAKNKGFYVSAALTSFLTGITEPIEFSFLFAAPWLYVIHAFFDGLSFFLADLFNIRVGNTFSGGLIDFILFGPLQGNAKTNWIRVIPIGIIWAILYYFLFRSLVSKFKIAIPGMQVEEGNKKENIVSDNNSDLENKSIQIIDALGNQENIEYVTACATRLRVTVKDKEKIDQELLKNLGATAVLEVENGIQAVFGSKANIYSSKINEILGRDD